MLVVFSLTCRCCGLKVKTEERLTVPWDAEDLVDQVKAWLPEGQTVGPRNKGITDLPMARLNARLAPLGYVIHASKGRDRTRRVACMDHDGKVTPFELFELRSIAPDAPGRTSDTWGQGNNSPLIGHQDAGQLQERNR
jgi:hypothetical protein